MQDYFVSRRHEGIDFIKLFASFWVILQHASGMGQTSTQTSLAICVNYFIQAVPFFFLASFFLQSTLTLQKYITRLSNYIIPFVAWSFIYTIARYLKSRHLDNDLISNLLSGNSIHLYFLPMLIWGLFIYSIINKYLNNASLVKLCIFFVVSMILRGIMVGFHCEFDLSTMTAFIGWRGVEQPAAQRLALIVLAWSLTLLPYMLAAKILVRHNPVSFHSFRFRWVLIVLSFALLILLRVLGVAREQLDPFIAVLLLSTAFAIGPRLNSSAIRRILPFSFGIYLCHFVFIELARIFLHRAQSATSITALLTAFFTLACSILLCLVVSKIKLPILHQIFGIRGA